MRKYHGVAMNLGGAVVPGATATIKSFLTGVNAPIFEDDNTTPKANPITCDSSGRFSFKCLPGLYSIVTAKDAYSSTDTEVMIIDDVTLAYLINDHGSNISPGDLCYVSGDGEVKRGVSTGTETQASIEVICVENAVLAHGSTGRFRSLGLVPVSGTPGAVGFLGPAGTIVTDLPAAADGDTYSVTLGRFVSSSLFNFKPSYPMAIF